MMPIVTRTMNAEPKSGWRVDPDGFLRVTARVLAPGVFDYGLPEIPEPLRSRFAGEGKDKVRERIDSSEFTDDALATLEGKPVIVMQSNDDPHKWRDPANTHEDGLTVGSVAGRPYRDDTGILADLLITDKDAIEAIRDGKHHDVSAAYASELEPVGDDDGASGEDRADAVQRALRFNHVLLLPPGRGRCGQEVRILNAQWEEGKHPRKHGQFAPKGQGSVGPGPHTIGRTPSGAPKIPDMVGYFGGPDKLKADIAAHQKAGRVGTTGGHADSFADAGRASTAKSAEANRLSGIARTSQHPDAHAAAAKVAGDAAAAIHASDLSPERKQQAIASVVQKIMDGSIKAAPTPGETVRDQRHKLFAEADQDGKFVNVTGPDGKAQRMTVRQARHALFAHEPQDGPSPFKIAPDAGGTPERKSVWDSMSPAQRARAESQDRQQAGQVAEANKQSMLRGGSVSRMPPVFQTRKV